MSRTFDSRFVRSGGLAGFFEAPANSFGWKGQGLLSIDSQGMSIALKRGLGTWVDAFDYSPPYTGPQRPVTEANIDEMVAMGVHTMYLQAGRLDTRSPDLLEDRGPDRAAAGARHVSLARRRSSGRVGRYGT